jgi:hypothetical protein
VKQTGVSAVHASRSLTPARELCQGNAVVVALLGLPGWQLTPAPELCQGNAIGYSYWRATPGRQAVSPHTS